MATGALSLMPLYLSESQDYIPEPGSPITRTHTHTVKFRMMEFKRGGRAYRKLSVWIHTVCLQRTHKIHWRRC